MGKATRRAVVIVSINIFLVALGLASGPTVGPGEISGTIRNENGKGLDGILVRLIHTDQQVSVSVITRGGRTLSCGLTLARDV